MNIPKRPSWQQSIKEVGPYIDLGMRLTVAMVAGVLGGLWLDKKIHTTPLFLILGFFLGSVTGFWSIYKTIYGKNQKQRDREKKQ